MTSKEGSSNNNNNGDNTAMSLCFGSSRIMNIILGFLGYHQYAIVTLRRVSKKFNCWVRPFVFSHLFIDYTMYQVYEHGHPFPFTPQRIVVDERLNEVPPTVTQIILEEAVGWSDSINSSNITHLLLRFPRYEIFTYSLDNLPSSLTHLELPSSLANRSIANFPPSITYIARFNQSIDKLPLSLTRVLFGEEFNQPVDYLPNSLVHLEFGKYFNQPLDRLPQSIKTILFSYDSQFNQKVDNLPHSLNKIEFGDRFDQTVDHLPPSITWIRFGRHFNKRVDNLPSSITRIVFGYDFNQRVDNLPQSLTHLKFGDKFNQPVDSLPPKLKYISFCGFNFKQTIDKLPSSLISLSIYYTPHQANIPPVTSLLIGKKLDRVKLPNSVTHLGFWGITFNEPIKGLPESITHLSTGGKFNQSIDELPDSITHLILGYNFNQKISRFPKSLLVLQLDKLFNQPLDNLPNSLTHLFLGPFGGSKFSYPLDNLPDSLVFLFFAREPEYQHRLSLRPGVDYYFERNYKLYLYFACVHDFPLSTFSFDEWEGE